MAGDKLEIAWNRYTLNEHINYINTPKYVLYDYIELIKKQNILLERNMSGESKRAFGQAYIELHADFMKVKMELEKIINLVEESLLSNEGVDQDLSNQLKGQKL